jgi:nucleoside phosphorylase
MSRMTPAECRAAARAIKAAEYGPEAIRVARPRSVLGIVRSRGPLSVLLHVAEAEGRLVRSGPDSFALLERPPFLRLPEPARGGFGLRLLRLLDRRWDVLVFAVPPVLALAAAAALVLVSVVRGAQPSLVIVGLALSAMVYIGVFMLAQVVNETAWLRRTFAGRAHDDLAAESLPGFNWSMPLCHLAGPDDGSRLLRLASDRMEHLVRREAAVGAKATGLEITDGHVREVLVCLTRGATTEAMRRVVAARLRMPYGPDSRVAFRRPLGPVTAYREPVKVGGGFFFLWIGGVAVVLAALAVFVVSIETQACGDSCTGRPTTYPAALGWLAWRLVWQGAPGITTVTWQTQTFGWLISVVGLMTIAVTAASARFAINRHREMLTEYQALAGDLPDTRVLLVTVTDTERKALLRAVRPVTAQEPERSFTGEVATYDLGSLGPTTLGLVQCGQQGAGGPGGAQSTVTGAIRKWNPHLIIMVGICYGLGDDWDPPQQLADVIVATSIYDLDRRIEHDDHTEHTGDRVSTRSAIVSRLRAASTDWHGASVWFGQLLSAQTLFDSRDRRDALKRENSRALGGEMEAHGLYAAAADADVPWIVVKAISDWGVGRDRYYEPEAAAANAAGFVAHAVALGAFDDWPKRR